MTGFLQKIVPGLFLVPAQNQGRFPFSHCFVARGETETLIDAGCGPKRLDELLTDWRPDQVIVSHSHPDHCSGLWRLAGSPIIAPVEHNDKFWRFKQQAERFVGSRELGAAWIKFAQESIGMREVTSDRCFGDGELFDLGKIKLRAIHAPGHLDDHYVFYEEKHSVALTFDIDLTAFGPWYGHTECDIDQFIDSINMVKELDPRILVSSHKGIITEDIADRLDGFAAVFAKRDRKLIKMLDKPRTVEELVDQSPFYGGHPYARPVVRYWEANMIAKHFKRLAAKGDVVFKDGRWGRG